MSDERVETIESAIKGLLPWFEINKASQIAEYTKKTPESYLGQFHLFPITELTISNDVEDVAKFINERYLNVLVASYKADLTLMTAITGKKGKIQIYLGFLTDKDKDPYVFQKIIEGVLPGIKTQYKETLNLRQLIQNQEYGGIVSGIPTLKIDDERQKFNISSVIRSMYGENYTLVIISKPVEQPIAVQQFKKILDIRDSCHKLSKQEKSSEKGFAESEGGSETHTKGSSKMSAKTRVAGSIGTAGGAVLGTIAGGGPLGTGAGAAIGGGLAMFISGGKYITESTTTGTSKGTEKHWSESLSFEQQNGVALELEKISENFIDRLKKGLNVGYWETTITFATETEAGRDILGGSFLGELSKPSTDNFPAKLNFAEIDKNQILLIPTTRNKENAGENNTEEIFPKSLCSYITSEELSLVASPPTESLPGYEIKRMPSLSLTDTPISDKEGSFNLGYITDHGMFLENSPFTLSHGDLVKHTFVCGITGSGKTTTVKQILKSANVPFLVLESAKRDYRKLYHDETFKNNFRIYTIGDATISPIRLNPFYIMPHISPLSHIDLLKAIFNASFSLYGPMPHILEKCLHNIYTKRGWNLTRGTHPFFLDKNGEYNETRYQEPEHYYCFPTLDDLKNEVDYYVKNNLEYKGEFSDNIRTAIVVRLESLAVGAKGVMFNTYDFPNLEELLKCRVIFEMEPLSDDDDKAFFVGLVLTFISELRQRNNPDVDPWKTNVKTLEYLLVIEEAHRLLKNVETERLTEMMGNPKGKAVETFCNIISEMRALGQGVIVVEQIPTKIAPDVIKNTNTKIAHRLVSKEDQLVLSGSLGINEDDALYLNRLQTGFALCHKEGMERPIEVKICPNINDDKISHEKVRQIMSKRVKDDKPYNLELNDFKSIVGAKGTSICIRFMNSLLITSEDEILKTISKTIEDIESILKQKGDHDTFGKETILAHIIESCISLFSQGIYSKNRSIPKNIYAILKSILVEKQIEKVSELQTIIKECWKTPSLADYLQGVVYNLSLNRFSQYPQKRFSDKEITKVVNDYFVYNHGEIVSELINKIKLHLGE